MDNLNREGDYVAAVRDVVEKGVRANPGHAAAIRKEGRDLCANYLIKRWDAANEEKRGHVRAKLERWRERLENHDAETPSSSFHHDGHAVRPASPDSDSHDDTSGYSSSGSDTKYPPVPPYGQGHSSPYFVPTPPRRRDEQSRDGSSPYHALGRRAGSTVRVLEGRQGGTGSGAW
ncbi:hypothetical protein JCM3775_003036 [Rhodotorula graminis]